MAERRNRGTKAQLEKEQRKERKKRLWKQLDAALEPYERTITAIASDLHANSDKKEWETINGEDIYTVRAMTVGKNGKPEYPYRVSYAAEEIDCETEIYPVFYEQALGKKGQDGYDLSLRIHFDYDGNTNSIALLSNPKSWGSDIDDYTLYEVVGPEPKYFDDIDDNYLQSTRKTKQQYPLFSRLFESHDESGNYKEGSCLARDYCGIVFKLEKKPTLQLLNGKDSEFDDFNLEDTFLHCGSKLAPLRVYSFEPEINQFSFNDIQSKKTSFEGANYYSESSPNHQSVKKKMQAIESFTLSPEEYRQLMEEVLSFATFAQQKESQSPQPTDATTVYQSEPSRPEPFSAHRKPPGY